MSWEKLAESIGGTIAILVIGTPAKKLIDEWLARVFDPSDTVAYTKVFALLTFDRSRVRVDSTTLRLTAHGEREREWEPLVVADPGHLDAPKPRRPLRYGSQVALFSTRADRFVGVNHRGQLTARERWVKHGQDGEVGAIFTIVGPDGDVSWLRRIPGFRRRLRYGDKFALRARDKRLVSYDDSITGDLVAVARRANDSMNLVALTVGQDLKQPALQVVAA
jgi:hypothetical protein